MRENDWVVARDWQRKVMTRNLLAEWRISKLVLHTQVSGTSKEEGQSLGYAEDIEDEEFSNAERRISKLVLHARQDVTEWSSVYPGPRLPEASDRMSARRRRDCRGGRVMKVRYS